MLLNCEWGDTEDGSGLDEDTLLRDGIGASDREDEDTLLRDEVGGGGQKAEVRRRTRWWHFLSAACPLLPVPSVHSRNPKGNASTHPSLSFQIIPEPP